MAGDLKQMQDPLGLLRLGYADALLRVPARQWRDGSFEARTEQIVEETPVAIVYNNIPHVVMMATPADLEDFVLGFSMTEELIRTPSDLEDVQIVRYGQGIEIQATIHPECEAVVASRTRRLTGRASFEMVQKATVFGAPLLAAISGPTGLAVRVAEQAGLTLVGFARHGRLTVYTKPERVLT